ncbi:hypothetical protein GYB61_10880 [bacterium]|nr:hypothetical protein [bacterium]
MSEFDPALFFPVLALTAWTLLILVVLIGRRVRHAGDAKVAPQEMRNPDMAYAICTESINNMANNFKHLFEVPVLFYVVSMIATLVGATSALMVALAWVFVGLRIVHSLIQCTVNVVMWRLAAFAFSVIVLIVMMGITALQLV